MQIPKPGGPGAGMRQLGIPTVVDRLVQQAILQVLEPLLDPTFSDSSYGFRPGRGAHDALAQAQKYVAEGRCIVVDVDLEKFFDRVNHDILMARLARRIADKRLLRIVRRFLQAGMMQDGVCIAQAEGTPQGGPLSPLLANLLLDDLDKELESRGHRFCRYADDCNIYVQSKGAGERVFASVTRFLEKTLRLPRQSGEKRGGVRGGTQVSRPPTPERRAARHRSEESGTGAGSHPGGSRGSRGIGLSAMIGELNSYLIGWVTYFRHAACKSHLAELDGWIRRKLRCVRLKQCKGTKTIADFLSRNGVLPRNAWNTAKSGKGWWRLASSPVVTHAMNNQWFETQRLVSLVRRHAGLNATKETAGYH